MDGLDPVSVIGILRLATFGADLAIRVPSSAEDEHPPAAHPELPAVTDQRREHEHTEDDEGRPDDPLHHVVDAGREPLPEDDRSDTDHEHHQRVPERVERPEGERLRTVILRAGDVGDRGDVVPVDPVAEAEQEGRDEQAEPESLRRRRGEQVGDPLHRESEAGGARFGK